MRPRPILTALLLVAAIFTPLAAQELSPEALQAIHNASRARVRLAGEGWHPLRGATADSASIAASGALLYVGNGRAGEPLGAVPLSRVAQVQVRTGSHAGSGAKIGGAIGLGLAVLALVVTSGDEWTSPTTGQVVSSLVVTPLFGAGVGALVGSASPRWRTVYGIDPP